MATVLPRFLSLPRELRDYIYECYSVAKESFYLHRPLRIALSQFQKHDQLSPNVLARGPQWQHRNDHALAFACRQVLQEYVELHTRRDTIIHVFNFKMPITTLNDISTMQSLLDTFKDDLLIPWSPARFAFRLDFSNFLSVRRDKSGLLDRIQLADGPVFFTSRSDRGKHFETMREKHVHHIFDTFVSPERPVLSATKDTSTSSERNQPHFGARFDWSKFHAIPKVSLPEAYKHEDADSETLWTSHIYHFHTLLDVIVGSSMDCGVRSLLELVLCEPPSKSLEIVLACHASFFTESIWYWCREMKQQVAAHLLLNGSNRDDSPLNKSSTFKTFTFTIEDTTKYEGDIIHEQRWSRSSVDNRLDECSSITR